MEDLLSLGAPSRSLWPRSVAGGEQRLVVADDEPRFERPAPDVETRKVTWILRVNLLHRVHGEPSREMAALRP